MTEEIIRIRNFINGEFRESIDTKVSLNPARGECNATVPESTKEDVYDAVASAKEAFTSWSKLPTQKRADYLLRVADLLENKLEEFAVDESADQGKPVWLTRAVDIPRAVLNFRHFAHAAPHLLNTSKLLPEAGTVAYTTREAIGVAGLISPWNLPMYLLTFKIAPALMYGNTVVAKPSELTSVTAYLLCQLFNEAGVPPGVLNMVFGTGIVAGAELVKHPDVKMISFTGSTAVGRQIAAVAAPLLKKLSLELGGKNSALVFSDCNLELTLSTLMRSSFINQGQVCLCTSKIYVHEDIYDNFLKKFVEMAKSKKVGDPNNEDVFLGALNSGIHLAKVQRCVSDAITDGGEVLCGETKDKLVLPHHLTKGYFMAPTVIVNMPDSARCMREEIFGPVVCVSKFGEDEEDVIRRANDVSYGLCASVFTKDLSRAHNVAHKLDVGTVWINSWLVRDLDLPFGGSKDSGIGREGTHDSWDFYTEQKTVSIKIKY